MLERISSFEDVLNMPAILMIPTIAFLPKTTRHNFLVCAVVPITVSMIQEWRDKESQ